MEKTRFSGPLIGSSFIYSTIGVIYLIRSIGSRNIGTLLIGLSSLFLMIVCMGLLDDELNDCLDWFGIAVIHILTWPVLLIRWLIRRYSH